MRPKRSPKPFITGWFISYFQFFGRSFRECLGVISGKFSYYFSAQLTPPLPCSCFIFIFGLPGGSICTYTTHFDLDMHAVPRPSRRPGGSPGSIDRCRFAKCSYISCRAVLVIFLSGDNFLPDIDLLQILFRIPFLLPAIFFSISKYNSK